MPEHLITAAFTIFQFIILGLLCFIARFVLSTSNDIAKLVTWSTGHEELDRTRFQSVHDQLERALK